MSVQTDETYYPIPMEEFMDDDVVVEICRHRLRNECSWEAVDPLHQTVMGSQAREFLRDTLEVLMRRGWQPPMPTYGKVHPRGRLRDVLNEQFYDWFRAVGRSVPRSISERVYHWHLGEARAIAHTKVARELNEQADYVDSMLDNPHLDNDTAHALEHVAHMLRTRADEWEDTAVDPRRARETGAVQ